MSGFLAINFNCYRGKVARLAVRRFRGLAKRLFGLAVVMSVLLVLLPTQADAQTYWLPQSGDWSNSLNWSVGLPEPGWNAYIDNGGTATINQTGGMAGTLYLGDSNGSGTVQITGANLQVGTANVGLNGVGAFTQSAGTNSTFLLNMGAQGTYNLNGGMLSVYEINNSSGPTFNFGGGVFQCNADGNPYVNVSTSMPVNMTGGSATVDTEVGTVNFTGNFSGSGSLTKIGSGLLGLDGSVNYNGNLQVSSGTLDLTASGQITSTNQYVGDNGTATFSQFSATNSASQLTLGYGASDSGTYTLTGGGVLNSTNHSTEGVCQ